MSKLVGDFRQPSTLNEIIGSSNRSCFLIFASFFFLLDPTVGQERPTFGGDSDVCRVGDLGMPNHHVAADQTGLKLGQIRLGRGFSN